MAVEHQVACGFAVSACTAVATFFVEWMPVLQGIAVIVSIAVGVCSFVLAVQKLRGKR